MRPVVAAGATAALFVVGTGMAFASRFESYEKANYSGAASTVAACGCNSIEYGGSYIFEYSGQTARVYKQKGCKGRAAGDLTHNSRNPDTVGGWKSIFILC
ncbi:MiAMP1 family antimicrobial peptide [Embleya sp. AB8]|uniref:MiAMP1 family antimicrobial peptide n=1 Tax=Embleya sp. AB8 TaxID=3156304 RepID=UPI003C755404